MDGDLRTSLAKRRRRFTRHLMEHSETSDPNAEVLNLSKVTHECLACGILVVDASRRICAINSDAERLLGLTPGVPAERPLDSLPRSILEAVRESFEKRAALPERHLELADTAARDVLSVSSMLCRGPDGCVNGVVLVLRDAGPAQKLEISLQRLDRLASIGTFSASIAHEIKNALVALNTFVQTLIERNRDSELTGLVGRELHRIDTVVSQVLKFAGLARPTFSRVSVHRILDQSLRLIQPQLTHKHIDLVRSFDARPEFVDGDEYQLEQAFLNILLNALAATETGGQLRVSTGNAIAAESAASSETAPAGWVDVTISDTGIGIPRENLGKLFEPFFSTKPHGTGLGLAITRQIVHAHHGRIEVESQEQKGTIFRIALPMRA